MDKDIEQQFADGIELRDRGELTQAANVFLGIIKKYPDDSKIASTYAVLAGVYFDLKDYNNSMEYFNRAALLKPQSELASLGLYLSFIELGKYESAITELRRYLDLYPAKLYKSTLEELLNDLDGGYALKFKEIILDLANKNEIPVPGKFFYNG